MRLHIVIQAAGWSEDLTAYASGISWEHGPTGPRSLTMPVPFTLRRAARLYDAQGVPPTVTVRRGPRTVWAGRVDRAGLAISRDGTTLTLRAAGGAAALRDIRHTALWSDTSTARWGDDPDYYPGHINDHSDKFSFDTNNRIFLTLEKNAVLTQFSGFIAAYDLPAGSSRNIAAYSFDYELRAPASVLFVLREVNAANATVATGAFAAGTGAVLNGTVNVTAASATQRLLCMFYQNSAAPWTNTDETGVNYLRITNLRVKTTTGAVTAGVIAQALLAEINATNSGQLSTSTALIRDPGLDLTDVVYEDAHALAILQGLAAKGDGAGTIYECGVDAERRLFFRPRGSAGRQWFVRLDDLRLERPRDSIENRVSARYQDANSRTLRTTAVTNAASLSRYGLIRDGVVNADTTSLTQAQQIRNTYAADVADPQPSARFGIRLIQRAGGGLVSGDEVLPGDTVTILGLPGRAEGLDRVRSFRVGESSYDAEGGPTLTPEEPLPSLDVLLAQQGRALDL